MKNNAIRHLAVVAAATIWLAAPAAAPKYIFLFIGDGMSMPQRMVADEFSRHIGRGPLAMNNLPYMSSSRTRSANQLITDSAAAATAIACGEKTNNSMLGQTPDGRRLESVAELAKRRGRKVGIVTTVTIVHATPAGFYAHQPSRSNYYKIALDLLASGFDYFAGAGVYKKYDDSSDSAYRGNVFDLAQRDGWRIVRSREELLALPPRSAKVWGVFADNQLDFSIDSNGTQPTLAEMVAKGIEFLDGPDGFFFMAEGGTVDYSAHANDAATNLRDVIAMDDAVKKALAFAKAHPSETLVVTTGDHETGGLSMGFAGTGSKFAVRLLARQKCSAGAFSTKIADLLQSDPSFGFAQAKPLVTENFGLLFSQDDAKTPDDRLLVLSANETSELESAFNYDANFIRAKKKETTAHDAQRRRKFAATARRLLNSHAGIGWSSGSHTALPVITTAYGAGAENFTGMMENCSIADKLKAFYR